LLASSRPPHRRGDYGNRAIWVLHGSRGNEPLFHRERRPSEKETRIVICAGSCEGNRTAVLRREAESPGKSHNTGGSLSMKNGWTGGQYSLFRAVFATYLFVHFLQLLLWGTELFANQDVLPRGTANPVLRLFPNVLTLSDLPGIVTALLAAGAVLTVFFGI